jgi:apolipoprotein D and lipocalin family protein
MACATPKELRTDGIPPVPELDLDRYQGLWYEIMRLPNRFEEGLENITATYTLQKDGEIKVINRGYDTEESEWSEADGRAWLPDPAQPGLLKVSFFWIFSSDYKVIALDQENYRYAMVTSSSKEYLWILSRTKEMDDKVLTELIDIAKSYGFAVEQLIKVNHEAINVLPGADV